MRTLRRFPYSQTRSLGDARKKDDAYLDGAIEAKPINDKESRYRGGVRIYLGEKHNAGRNNGARFFLDLNREDALELAVKVVGLVRSQLRKDGRKVSRATP